MGTILTIAGWLTALACAEVTVSFVTCSVISLKREMKGGQPADRDPDDLMPGVVAAAGVAILVLLGVVPVLLDSLLATALFAFGVWFLSRQMLEDSDEVSWPGIAGAVAMQPMHAFMWILDDIRLLAGLRDRARQVPVPAEGPVPARPRRLPSTALPDPDFGPALHPAAVAAGLESANVAVPSCWAAVAEWEATFEPEDEDDWRNHQAERAAGILTVAQAAGEQAEDQAVTIKLDPAVTAAGTDFADDFADTASAAVRVVQVYDAVTASLQEHLEGGGTLVENARQWHGVDGPGAEGGQAA